MSRRLWCCSVLLSLLFACTLALWYRVDTRPAAWDESVHLNLALDYKDYLVHATPVTTPWAAVYPPLYHLSLIPALSVGAPSEARAVLTHTLYLLLLVSSLMMLAGAFGRPMEDGLLAALLVLAYPLVLYAERRPLIDFPLMAWVALGMLLLWRTERFSKPAWTLGWAAVSGLGMLMKPFYAMWFVGPCLWMWGEGRTEHTLKGRWKVVLLSALFILAISLTWYGWQGPLFWRNAVGLVGERGAAEGDPSFATLGGWLYYLRGLWVQMGPVGFLATLGGILMLAFHREETAGKGFLFAWFLSGSFLFTLVRNKDLRYTLPFLPALALLAVMGWRAVAKLSWTRSCLIPLFLALFLYNAFTVDRPQAQDWKHREIGELLAARRDPSQPYLIASVLANHPYFFGRSLRWSMRTRGQTLFNQPAADPEADFTEFIITKSGDLGPDSASVQKEWARLRQSGRAFSAVYPEIAKFPLPDTSEATVYRRNPDAVFDIAGITRQALEERLTRYLRREVQGPLKVAVEGAAADFRKGRLSRVRISGGPWVVRDLRIEQADILLDRVWLNLYQLWDHGQPGVLALDSIQPRFKLRAEDLEDLLRRKARGFEGPQVRIRKNHVEVTGIFHGIPVRAEAVIGLEKSPPQLTACLRRVSFRGLALPGWLLGKAHRQRLPLAPIPSFPASISIRSIAADNGLLEVQ